MKSNYVYSLPQSHGTNNGYPCREARETGSKAGSIDNCPVVRPCLQESHSYM